MRSGQGSKRAWHVRECQRAPVLAARSARRLYCAVPPAAIVVSDAHLGFAPQAATDGFHRFLAAVPTRGDHLVVNGDLFEFWFEYRSVIPRHAFPTLARLEALVRAGVRLTVTGGNHDRWGGGFWRELGATFHPRGAELDLAGHRALVAHGDGITDRPWSARLLHRVTGHPVTTTLFRWVHPDVGIGLVARLSPWLAGKRADPASIAHTARAQAVYARRVLAERADLDLLVLGHTHHPVLEPVGARRWYVNPGAWMDGFRYAAVTAEGPRLARFDG